MRRRLPLPRTPQQAAHLAVAEALKSGALPPKGKCATCDRPARHYHHHSYAPQHRLDVAPLCIRCHAGVHAGKIPEPLTGELRTGLRRKQGRIPYQDDESALYAVLCSYPRPAPFMRRPRRAELERFLDERNASKEPT